MFSASLRFLCVSASKIRSSAVSSFGTTELPWRERDHFGALRSPQDDHRGSRRMTAASHEETASPSISVTPFGKFSRLTNSSADDTVCARSRTRSIPQADKLRRDAAGATVGRRFDVVSPVVGWLATTDRFAEFQSTDPDRYGSDKGSRSVHARRGVEPDDRIPPALKSPSGGSVLLLGGSSFPDVHAARLAKCRRPRTCERQARRDE